MESIPWTKKKRNKPTATTNSNSEQYRDENGNVCVFESIVETAASPHHPMRTSARHPSTLNPTSTGANTTPDNDSNIKRGKRTPTIIATTASDFKLLPHGLPGDNTPLLLSLLNTPPRPTFCYLLPMASYAHFNISPKHAHRGI